MDRKTFRRIVRAQIAAERHGHPQHDWRPAIRAAARAGLDPRGRYIAAAAAWEVAGGDGLDGRIVRGRHVPHHVYPLPAALGAVG